jgi:hypothetical protein
MRFWGLALAIGLFAMPARAELPGPDVASTSPDSRALVGGSVLFGVGYGAALYVGQKNGFLDERGWLAVPVAGPWIVLASKSDLSSWGMVADGITQAGGGLIIVGSFVYPRRVLGPPRAQGIRIETASVRPGGLSLGGSF